MQLNWFNLKFQPKKHYLNLIQQKIKKDDKKVTITSFSLEDIIISKQAHSTK